VIALASMLPVNPPASGSVADGGRKSHDGMLTG
jgi:hypothetical protein